MDRFIGDLRRHTQQLKERHLDFAGLSLRYDSDLHYDDDDDDDIVLRCDRYLRVHWKNFAKALRSFDENCEETRLSGHDELMKAEDWQLSKIELSEDLRDLLEPIIAARSNLRSLILNRNEFGRDGVVFLCNIVERNLYLKSISFRNNPIKDLRDMTRFCDAVSKHPSLEQLNLENAGLCHVEDKISIILDACKKLECLDLSGNGIGSQSAAVRIARFLASNDNTKMIYLRDNNFDDRSASLFATALRNSECRRIVDLRGNRFTQSGGSIILNALFDTSSLNAAVDSNHSSIVFIEESRSEELYGVINCNGTPEENLHKKIFSTLYATTDGARLGHLLNDIPLGLMPDLLAYLQEFYLDDIHRGMRKHAMKSLQHYTLDDFEETFSRQTTLTVMFEALRNWNLPLLYTSI